MNIFALALSNLMHRKTRTALTMLGVIIGIAAVVSLIGLGEGLRFAIVSQFGFLGGDILTVRAAGVDYAGPPGTGAAVPLTGGLADEISGVSGVEAAINRYTKSVTFEFNGRQTIGIVGSVPEGKNRKFAEKMANLKAEKGRLLKDGDMKKVVLGNNFRNSRMFGREIGAGDQVLVDGITFDVAGILERKGNFLLDSSVAMNEETMIDLLGVDKNTVNAIAVKVKDPDNINKVKAGVERVLRKERGVDEGKEDFVVETPQKILESVNSALFAVQLFVYVIAAIALAVGGIGIMNTMYTSVMERTKEIGILKSIGATNSAIFSLFFVESGLMGMAGGLAGIAVGTAFAYALAFAGRIALGTDLIQIQISPLLITGALAFSFIIGIIFGVLPAYQASKLRPVESLRDAR